MHPAIELLIARMQSNPEEFIRGEWDMEEGNCMAHANEEELAALKATRRTITLDGIHKLIMKHSDTLRQQIALMREEIRKHVAQQPLATADMQVEEDDAAVDEVRVLTTEREL